MRHPSPIAAPGVYIAALSDGTVKIGSTGDLGRRWPQLERDYRADVLLGWLPTADRESASSKLEHVLHEAFYVERQGCSERFKLSRRITRAILAAVPRVELSDQLGVSRTAARDAIEDVISLDTAFGLEEDIAAGAEGAA